MREYVEILNDYHDMQEKISEAINYLNIYKKIGKAIPPEKVDGFYKMHPSYIDAKDSLDKQIAVSKYVVTPELNHAFEIYKAAGEALLEGIN
ncbi:hypothetical protein [Sulfitobacter sp. R18_1]|uniref:hypothetical protein n=1 Tax=Sulfitobacter sp. R18_1 TaxID=2821104 RepID=UPI001ADA1CD4|nr:hypothetical protein [Sulfitobacter sp. R18_1]MBO9428199.1 hypothetical protein [Sulfitobacter sp. R18_1]